MEGFDTNISSTQSALQQTPKVFETVRVNLPVNISDGVIYDLVGVLARQSFVREQRIAVESRAGLDVLSHFRLKSVFLSIPNNGGSHFPTALQNPHHDCFVFPASSSDTTLALGNVHIASFSADERLIDLDFSTELCERTILQSEPDTVKHEPCSLLCDLQISCDFIGTDSVFAIGNQPDGGKPLVQTERRILEDGSDLDRELSFRMFALALPQSAAWQKVDFRGPAAWTGYTTRPSSLCNIIQAVVGIREVQDCFLKGLWFFGHDFPRKQNGTIGPYLSQVYFYPVLPAGESPKHPSLEDP
jgi:hypothetical protein